MDLSFIHGMSTERIIEVLLERQIHLEALRTKSREELIEIYNKLVVPLPQRRPKGEPEIPTCDRIFLKRKVDEGGDSASSVKVVRRGINELKIDKLKRRSGSVDDDDPMDGSLSRKRIPITWP